MKSKLLVLSTLTLAATLCAAQTPTKPDVGNSANKSPNGIPADATFMKTLAIGGTAEVDAGKLATSKATNSEVKQFAQTMVNDHSKNNEKLKSLAKEKQVDLPVTVDQEHAEAQSKLEKQNGAAFDAEYMQAQVKDHQKTVQLLQHEINAGQDASVKAFARETLPVVQHHLEMAKEIEAKLSHSKH